MLPQTRSRHTVKDLMFAFDACTAYLAQTVTNLVQSLSHSSLQQKCISSLHFLLIQALFCLRESVLTNFVSNFAASSSGTDTLYLFHNRLSPPVGALMLHKVYDRRLYCTCPLTVVASLLFAWNLCSSKSSNISFNCRSVISSQQHQQANCKVTEVLAEKSLWPFSLHLTCIIYPLHSSPDKMIPQDQLDTVCQRPHHLSNQLQQPQGLLTGSRNRVEKNTYTPQLFDTRRRWLQLLKQSWLLYSSIPCLRSHFEITFYHWWPVHCSLPDTC